MQYYYPDELYHHGVKGMKWGVRKRTPIGNAFGINKRKRAMQKKNEMEYRKEAYANKREHQKYIKEMRELNHPALLKEDAYNLGYTSKKDVKNFVKSSKKDQRVWEKQQKAELNKKNSEALKRMSEKNNKISREASKEYHKRVTQGQIIAESMLAAGVSVGSGIAARKIVKSTTPENASLKRAGAVAGLRALSLLSGAAAIYDVSKAANRSNFTDKKSKTQNKNTKNIYSLDDYERLYKKAYEDSLKNTKSKRK